MMPGVTASLGLMVPVRSRHHQSSLAQALLSLKGFKIHICLTDVSISKKTKELGKETRESLVMKFLCGFNCVSLEKQILWLCDPTKVSMPFRFKCFQDVLQPCITLPLMHPDSRAQFGHGPVTAGLGTRSRQLVDGAVVPCACLGHLVRFVMLPKTVFELVLSAIRCERAEVGPP